MIVTREQIVEEARKWLGTPWRHQGRTDRGIDCAGLVVKVAHALGQSTFDDTSYQRTAQKQKLMSYFEQELDTQPLQQLRPGDVVLFRDNSYPCHVGIVTEKHGLPYLIHAHAIRRCVIEEPFTVEWRSKWVAGYKFKGVQD